MAKTDRLDIPGRSRTQWLPRMRMDRDAFGSFAESFARWMGTAQFLMWMTVLIIAWVVWNVVWPGAPDPFPFLFLTLALSLQASYAAPLILLAQNRQEARDRLSFDEDLRIAAQSRADMDFLAREIAAIRMHLGELATRDFVRSELRSELRELAERLDGAEDKTR